MLIGTIVNPPELRFTPTGKVLAIFDLKTMTSTIHCVAWEDVADGIAANEAFFEPNANVIVTGYFKTREFTNNKGITVSRTEYNIKEILLESI